jgi:hypothetical protein
VDHTVDQFVVTSINVSVDVNSSPTKCE